MSERGSRCSVFEGLLLASFIVSCPRLAPTGILFEGFLAACEHPLPGSTPQVTALRARVHTVPVLWGALATTRGWLQRLPVFEQLRATKARVCVLPLTDLR